MTENSKIEWTDHTFNPWIGCARVSPACEHCYAESMSKHYGWAAWGTGAANGTRRITSPANWREPLRWDRQASQTGKRARVFCASLADVFEDFEGIVFGGVTLHTASLDHQRERLWHLIQQTPALDWLLLTKRAENMARMLPAEWTATMPPNVWLGTTVETQGYADERIPHLALLRSAVRFLSIEPQLGPLDLTRHLDKIHWVICGGESGAGARPMQVVWARSVRDQCVAAGVPFFFKQWGNHPQVASGEELVRLRTKNERLLDGRTWDEIPRPRSSGTHRDGRSH